MESVDRNVAFFSCYDIQDMSLSAWRAWIEIHLYYHISGQLLVALRMESVDRNDKNTVNVHKAKLSLSAWRAWIEIPKQRKN